jgi:hypothetical protein
VPPWVRARVSRIARRLKFRSQNGDNVGRLAELWGGAREFIETRCRVEIDPRSRRRYDGRLVSRPRMLPRQAKSFGAVEFVHRPVA